MRDKWLKDFSEQDELSMTVADILDESYNYFKVYAHSAEPRPRYYVDDEECPVGRIEVDE